MSIPDDMIFAKTFLIKSSWFSLSWLAKYILTGLFKFILSAAKDILFAPVEIDSASSYAGILQTISYTYPNVRQKMLFGVVRVRSSSSGSWGFYIAEIYDTSDLNSNDLPNYSSCMFVNQDKCIYMRTAAGEFYSKSLI